MWIIIKHQEDITQMETSNMPFDEQNFINALCSKEPVKEYQIPEGERSKYN